jgi:hypothetical protein
MPKPLRPGTRLRTEKEPRPRRQDWPPPGSIPYQVTDLDMKDGWKGVARKHGVDVQHLIRHNFRTNDPDEVNWYLREYVGCNVTTDDLNNWMFSSSAKPGKIYLPIDKTPTPETRVINGDDHEIVGRKTTVQSSFAKKLMVRRGPNDPVLETFGKGFDAMDLIEIGLALLSRPGLLPPHFMIVTLPASQFARLGALHEPAIRELQKKYILEGLTRGIVLAADGRTPQWIEAHGFFQKWPIDSATYPRYAKQFQDFYNTALAAGIAHGQEMSNTVASTNLFVAIQARMTDYAKSEYSGDYKRWSDTKCKDYYRLCARILESQIKFSGP